MKKPEDMTAGELLFLDQRTRQILVGWCDAVLITGQLPIGPISCPAGYLDYAIFKKWISADKTKILSLGWKTAASFLKR